MNIPCILFLAFQCLLIKTCSSERTVFRSYNGVETNSPACVDFDGDGDTDCFSGQENGWIRYYENVGTELNYDFERNSAFDFQTDQQEVKPFIADLDGDGDYDFYVGGKNGLVTSYMNDGAGNFILNNSDVFGDAIRAYKTSSSPASGGLVKRSSSTLQNKLSKFALPLVVTGLTSASLVSRGGGGGGRSNTAAAGAVSILSSLPSPVCASRDKYVNLPNNKFGYRADPFCADIDGDGDLDCVVGFEKGSVSWFENVGDKFSPLYSVKKARIFRLHQNKDTLRKNRRNAHPVLVDFDGDGDYDLLVGSRNKKVRMYQHQGGKFYDVERKHRQMMTLQTNGQSQPWCGKLNNKTMCILGDTRNKKVKEGSSGSSKQKSSKKEDETLSVTLLVFMIIFIVLGATCAVGVIVVFVSVVILKKDPRDIRTLVVTGRFADTATAVPVSNNGTTATAAPVVAAPVVNNFNIFVSGNPNVEMMQQQQVVQAVEMVSPASAAPQIDAGLLDRLNEMGYDRIQTENILMRANAYDIYDTSRAIDIISANS